MWSVEYGDRMNSLIVKINRKHVIIYAWIGSNLQWYICTSGAECPFRLGVLLLGEG
jgi:hypothetical protein